MLNTNSGSIAKKPNDGSGAGESVIVNDFSYLSSPPMTVCIAALAEDRKKAVLISDKRGTIQGILPIQSDGDLTKIFKINDNVTAMWAGGVVDAITILEDAKKSLTLKKTAKEVAECINDKHLSYLHNIIERRDIIGRGLKSLNEFYKDKTINILDDIRRQIDTNLSTNNLSSNTTFLVCGKESDGLYKIYLLPVNPRFNPIWIPENYSMIGSGEIHARASLLHSTTPYNVSLPVAEVQKIALEAKKKAELSPDVGPSEDIAILE